MIYSNISTIFSTVTMHKYSSTTISGIVIGEITTTINKTVTTYPYDSTTVSTTIDTTNVAFNFTSSIIIFKSRVTYTTIVTTPMYSTTTTFSNVVNKSGIGNITMSSTCSPVNSTTIRTSNVVNKVTKLKTSIIVQRIV